MRNNPKLSVITPTYNRAHLLPRVWKSLKVQTCADFEWIVVDDGSTDETESVVAGFSDPRIRYVRLSKNRGVSAARNRGIDISRSPYLVFLDSDDEMLPTALEEITETWSELNDPQVGRVCFRYVVSETGELLGTMKGTRLLLDYEEAICGQRTRGDFVNTVRREAFDHLRFDEDVTGVEQGVLWWRMARKWKTLYINRPLAIYHSGSANQLTGTESTVVHAADVATGYDRLWREHEKTLLENCPHKYGYYLLASAFNHALAGNRRQALDRAWQALLHQGDWKKAIPLLLVAPLGGRLVGKLFRLRAKIRKQ